MPFNLALKMHFDDLDIHSWTDYLSTTCRKKGCHSMLFASFTRMTTCNHNQGQMLKLLTTDFKGNKVYAIIVGLKAVNVTAYCVFISVNSVHSPIVNPELKTLPIQWNRVLNEYAIYCQKITKFESWYLFNKISKIKNPSNMLMTQFNSLYLKKIIKNQIQVICTSLVYMYNWSEKQQLPILKTMGG